MEESNFIREKLQQLDHTVSDEQIIDGVISGRKNIYEVIMRRYNQRLFRIGHAYLQDEEEIEDLIQSTYIKAYEQLDRFENRSKFSTWLIRIFINEALQRVKQKKRYSTISEEELESRSISEKYYFREIDMNSPYRQTINNELREVLEKAVDGLPEKYKAVFIMREIEEMSISETSQCLNISESNVKVRLNRAKEMLREGLSQYYHDKDIFNFNLLKCNKIVDAVLENISKTK
ncbi:MAG: RNA polymerase sigma factor [Bacteroidota bacterium]|nr:RNA polymerase sigma factor [Bacteroidota bacterium]MDP4190891.1 RNA polymerase sigma factor [Bacteroidota bacterium]MDP4195295.1 RNA polymerase sigma factor [Bacteroidota bacterium]